MKNVAKEKRCLLVRFGNCVTKTFGTLMRVWNYTDTKNGNDDNRLREDERAKSAEKETKMAKETTNQQTVHDLKLRVHAVGSFYSNLLFFIRRTDFFLILSMIKELKGQQYVI